MYNFTRTVSQIISLGPAEEQIIELARSVSSLPLVVLSLKLCQLNLLKPTHSQSDDIVCGRARAGVSEGVTCITKPPVLTYIPRRSRRGRRPRASAFYGFSALKA